MIFQVHFVQQPHIPSVLKRFQRWRSVSGKFAKPLHLFSNMSQRPLQSWKLHLTKVKIWAHLDLNHLINGSRALSEAVILATHCVPNLCFCLDGSWLENEEEGDVKITTQQNCPFSLAVAPQHSLWNAQTHMCVHPDYIWNTTWAQAQWQQSISFTHWSLLPYVPVHSTSNSGVWR